MPRDTRGGFDTHWTKYGHGPRDALLIHCSLAHSGAWAGFAHALDDSLNMIAFDLPGHGRSADWDDRDDIQTVSTAMARDFVQAPADIIGHSFGATVALRLALEQPNLVRSLTLIEPVLFAAVLVDEPVQTDAAIAANLALAEALEGGDRETVARNFTRVWGDGRRWNDLPMEMRRSLTKRIHLIEANNPSLFRDTGGLLVHRRLEAVKAPVLLVEGTNSPGVVAKILDKLQGRLTNTRRVEIDNAGHMVPITHPVAVANAVAEFLAIRPSG